MKYKIESKFPKDQYDKLIGEGQFTDETIQRELVLQAIHKLKFSELSAIRKISFLKVDPYSNTPYNGCKPLFLHEQTLISDLRESSMVLFEVTIITTTGEKNGTN